MVHIRKIGDNVIGSFGLYFALKLFFVTNALVYLQARSAELRDREQQLSQKFFQQQLELDHIAQENRQKILEEEESLRHKQAQFELAHKARQAWPCAFNKLSNELL